MANVVLRVVGRLSTHEYTVVRVSSIRIHLKLLLKARQPLAHQVNVPQHRNVTMSTLGKVDIVVTLAKTKMHANQHRG